MNFWDLCSGVYDFAQRRNVNYEKWHDELISYIDSDCTVLDVAGGTGELAIRTSGKVKHVVYTDLSKKMLKVGKKKARGIPNISFRKCSIYNIPYEDNSFDVVIASQILHLLDDPQKAVNELIRVSNEKIILPMTLTKEVHGFAKFQIGIWKKLGFNPQYEFTKETYLDFLKSLGLNIVEFKVIEGNMPIIIVVCKKSRKDTLKSAIKEKFNIILKLMQWKK